MMDKGKKPSNGEEDDFLKNLMMMDYDKQYPKPMEAAENILSGDCSSSSESSKGDCNSVTDETDDAEKDQLFSKFLALGSPGFTHDLSSSSSNKAPTNGADNNDLASIICPPEMAEQTPVAARSATRSARLARGLRKAMPPDMLAILSMQDPKKARRIITNRMSAIRAKEKKKLYTYMLEHKLHTLQTEAATSNAHLALIQTETMGLNAENARLKEQTSMVIQQIHFQDSLNDGLRNEIQNLRMLTQMGTNTNHHHQGMVFNNVNHNNNVGMDSRIGTEQFFPVNNNNQNYHEYHHQVPNYPYDQHHQVEQLENRVEQMNIGQQFQYPPFNQELPPKKTINSFTTAKMMFKGMTRFS